MTAATVNLIIEQGTTFDQTFIWQDETSNPIDLTGFTAQMQIRESVTSPEVIIELSTSNGRIVLGGTAGTILLQLTGSETEALDFDQAIYDLELTDVAGSGDITRLIQGNVVLSKEVTK